MPISTSCSCGRKLNLKDELAGKTVKCPQCGTALKVPDSKSTATAVATPPPRPAPEDSRRIEKPGKQKDDKAGPKLAMGNFKSLEDFDDAGNFKKKKKTYTKEEEESSEVGGGTTGGAMAQIAAEALKAEKDKPKLRCPGCGRGVKPEDVICTKCGTNIKTGRRIGESAIKMTPRKMLILFGIAAISGAGALYQFTKIPPKTADDINKGKVFGDIAEDKSTIAKLAELVNDSGDQEIDKTLPCLANLGGDALPTLCDALETGTPVTRKKAVRLLEIMAFNGYRSEDSVIALGALCRDADTSMKDAAAEALFWSAYDLPKNANYWVASEMDPQRTTDVSMKYKLPYSDCRQQLQGLGVKVRMDAKNGKSLQNLGNFPPRMPVVPMAARALGKYWEAETIQGVKLTRLIQTVRAGGRHLMIRLIYYLEKEPCTKLGFTPPSGDVERAFRCLHDITGRANRRYDDWELWWNPAAGKSIQPAQPQGHQNDYPKPPGFDEALPPRSRAKPEEPK